LTKQFTVHGKPEPPASRAATYSIDRTSTPCRSCLGQFEPLLGSRVSAGNVIVYFTFSPVAFVAAYVDFTAAILHPDFPFGWSDFL
jgi:hypothetical protein